MFACWELINSPGTGAAQPDGGQQAAGTCAGSERSNSTDTEPRSFGYQGIPLYFVAGAVRFPAVQIALPRSPSIPGRRRQQPGLSRGAAAPAEPGLVPAALLRALVMAGPACRQTGLKTQPCSHRQPWLGKTGKCFIPMLIRFLFPPFSSLLFPEKTETPVNFPILHSGLQRLVLNLSLSDKKEPRQK